ncbi:MAG: hypothetical protein JW915_19490 [Chitinispirillaceae bacterium]|nr:hypothetical protein [Chitinispirillaceae bacterium]
MHKIKVLTILILLICAASAFEIGLSQRGFELGFSGKRHFKILNIYDVALSNEEFDSRVSLLIQWISLRKERLSVNFSSSVGLGFNGGIPLEVGIINFEPEIMIGKNASFYMRGSLFGMLFEFQSYGLEHYTYTGLIAPGIRDLRNEKNIIIGIRLKFKNRQ